MLFQKLWIAIENFVIIHFYERLLVRKKAEKLYLVLGGHIFFQTLAAASELDLFSMLAASGPLPLNEIAKKLHLEEKPARILLLGCVTLGLLKKRGETYENSLVAKKVLCKGAPQNIQAIILWQKYINYKAMSHFTEALIKNKNVGLEEFQGDEKTLYERLAHTKQLEDIFQDAMEEISSLANALLVRYVDFSRTTSLVDIGGGNGANVIMLAKKYPQLKASVFDSPTVCTVARERFASSGAGERLSAVPGDCFRDPFPEGNDCILFCHFLTIWSEDKNIQLLKKAHEALPEGGRVIVFNMMQDEDGSGPISAAMGSPYFLTLATGEGMLYSTNEYIAWMKEAGFRSVKKSRLPRDHYVIIGTK